MGLYEHPPQKLFLWCVLLLSVCFLHCSLQLNCLQAAFVIDCRHRPRARQPQSKWNKTQTGQKKSINIYQVLQGAWKQSSTCSSHSALIKSPSFEARRSLHQRVQLTTVIAIGFNYLEAKARLVILELKQRNCISSESLCEALFVTQLQFSGLVRSTLPPSC